MDSEYKTVIFWDFETCPVEKEDMGDFISLIRQNYSKNRTDLFFCFHTTRKSQASTALEEKFNIKICIFSDGYKKRFFENNVCGHLKDNNELVLLSDDESLESSIKKVKNHQVHLIHGKRFNLHDISKMSNLIAINFDKLRKSIEKQTGHISNGSQSSSTETGIDKSSHISLPSIKKPVLLNDYTHSIQTRGQRNSAQITESAVKVKETEITKHNTELTKLKQVVRERESEDGGSIEAGKKVDIPFIDEEEEMATESTLQRVVIDKNENVVSPGTAIRTYQIEEQEISRVKRVRFEPRISGLVNLGNTCYMNSGLQCLFSVKLLTEFALEFYTWPIYQQMKNSVFGRYSSLVHKMSKNKMGVSPREFKMTVSEHFEVFRGYQQNDCSEFIASVLNKFDEELSSIRERDLQNSDPSLISSIFKGFQKFYWVCNKNHRSNESTMPFHILNLPQFNPENNKTIPVENSLRKYLMDREVEAEVECEKCNQLYRPTEKIGLLQTPKILILQLKTNPQYSYRQYCFEFPTHLDTSDFVPEIPSNTYELIAVSNYSGNAHSGHYTAYAKSFDNQKWYEFNDSYLSELKKFATRQRISSATAYLLFYEKST